MSSIILAICCLVLAGVLVFLYIKIRNTLIGLFGTADLLKLIRERDREAEDTPRSISGATELVLPRLKKDFPELSWQTIKSMAEKDLRAHLNGQGYTGVLIHQTVLFNYRKDSGLCEVQLRSAVQYYVKEQKNQAKYAITYAYVQDADAFGYEKGVSFTCPSCGAPVKALGEKTCAYCGAAVEPLTLRVWKLASIKAE